MLPHHRGLTIFLSGVSFNDNAVAFRYKYRRHPHQQRPSLLLPQQPLPPSAPTSGRPPPSYLALMTTGTAAYSYNLAQLGYPHYLAPPQQTEPFWDQFDHVREASVPPHNHPTFGYTHYNYVYDPFGMQNFVPVFIGSNTANGRVLKGDEVDKRSKYSGDKTLKPFGRVSVFVDNSHIGNARLQDLIRFSRTIGIKFMKEGQVEAETMSVEKLGFTVQITRAANGARTVKLVNSHSKIWAAPPIWAFSEVLAWMHDVHNLDRNVTLSQFTVPGIEDYTLHELVALYAATIILELRPAAVATNLRGRIIEHLAYLPVTGDDFQYLHEHLLVGDVVLRKMIETFFMHGERNHYRQKGLRGEVEKIQGYVNGCGHEEFNTLVIGMMESRNKARAAQVEGFQGNGKSSKAETSKGVVVKKATASEAAEGQKETTVKQDADLKAAPASPKDSALGTPPKQPARG